MVSPHAHTTKEWVICRKVSTPCMVFQTSNPRSKSEKGDSKFDKRYPEYLRLKFE